VGRAAKAGWAWQEVQPGGLVELYREVELRQAVEACGELVDGIVVAGLGAMTARVVHFQPETLKYLLARLNAVIDWFAVLDAYATALVERELRIDEIPMIVDEPADAIAGGVAAWNGSVDQSSRFASTTSM
jgi:hypothetical protein